MIKSHVGQSRVEREMDAFRAAQADPRTEAQLAVDVAVRRLAREACTRAAAGVAAECGPSEPSARGAFVASSPL